MTRPVWTLLIALCAGFVICCPLLVVAQRMLPCPMMLLASVAIGVYSGTVAGGAAIRWRDRSEP